MVSDFIWRIFEVTGSVTAYILYKQMIMAK